MRHLRAVSLCALFVTVPLLAQSRLEKAVEKAREQVEKGKPEDAVKTLVSAAEETGAEGYLALASLQERLGRREAARAAYDQARVVATPALRPDVLAAGASFALRAGTGADALALADQAVDASTTAATLAAQARARVRTGDAGGALESADEAVALDPRHALARIGRGEALFALGRNVEAEDELRRAVELDPRSALARSRLCRVQIALGKTGEAVASGREATELDDTLGEAFAVLGAAILADDQENWSDAIAEAQQGAFLDPGNPLVQTVVGRILVANGQHEQAVASFRRALRTDPGYVPARLALIEAELARGNRDAAMAEATRGAGSGPASPRIQMLLGEMAERDGRHAEALGHLEPALTALPGDADGWALLGRAYQQSGRPNDAAPAYRRAVELAPQNLSFRTTYGLVLGLGGDLEGGLAQLEQVVATPGYAQADAWVNLGWIHRSMNEPAESITAYRKALEIDPSQAQAALGLGWAHTRKKEYDEAIGWYDKAVALDPALAADAYWGTTLAYIHKLDPQKAREFQGKTIAAGRDDPRIEAYIGKLEEGLSHRAELLEQLQREQQREADRLNQVFAARSAIRSSDPAVRARGARELVLDADSGVDILIYLMRTDPDWNVRIEAAKSLGAFGPGAGEAVPHLRGILNLEQVGAPLGRQPTQEELENEMLDGDLRKAVREALARIER